MSLYNVTKDAFTKVEATTFQAAQLLERRDLQKHLRNNIGVLGDDLFVIAEEFGGWEDSNRRIDLLCLTKTGGLAVIEIKRTEDGGHMDLQAIRYAAMVSSMTRKQAATEYGKLNNCSQAKAAAEISKWLGDSENPTASSQQVRIVLVSADFSKEITTAVMWLRRQGLDIRCVRMQPFEHGKETLVHFAEIIPLPEARDYEVRLREQDQEARDHDEARKRHFERYWREFFAAARSRIPFLDGRNPPRTQWLSVPSGRPGISFAVVLGQSESRVECYIAQSGGAEANAATFHALCERKASIEGDFGESLDWQELPERDACRICAHLEGGWQTPETDWPDSIRRQIDALTRLMNALKDPLAALPV
jgi:hypothetical protein